MQARTLAARRGVFWLLEGWQLFRQNPALLTALTMAYLFIIMVVIGATAGLGTIVLPFLVPLLTLMLGNGIRVAEKRVPIESEMLLEGIRGNGRNLLRLGGLQLLGMLIMTAIEQTLRWLDIIPDLPAKPNLRDIAPVILGMSALSIPFLMAYMFSPYLVGWHRTAALPALFFSFIGCWRNLRVLLVWLICALLIAVGIPVILTTVITLLSPSVSVVLRYLLQLVLLFLFVPVFSTSIYIAYRDIFEITTTPPQNVDG